MVANAMGASASSLPPSGLPKALDRVPLARDPARVNRRGQGVTISNRDQLPVVPHGPGYSFQLYRHQVTTAIAEPAGAEAMSFALNAITQ